VKTLGNYQTSSIYGMGCRATFFGPDGLVLVSAIPQSTIKSNLLPCVRMYFDHTDSTIQDLISKMMVLDGKVFGTGTNGFRVCNSETALVIFIDFRCKLTREDVSVRYGHVINEAVSGEFLNQTAHGEQIMHTSAKSLVLGFGCT